MTGTKFEHMSCLPLIIHSSGLRHIRTRTAGATRAQYSHVHIATPACVPLQDRHIYSIGDFAPIQRQDGLHRTKTLEHPALTERKNKAQWFTCTAVAMGLDWPNTYLVRH